MRKIFPKSFLLVALFVVLLSFADNNSLASPKASNNLYDSALNTANVLSANALDVYDQYVVNPLSNVLYDLFYDRNEVVEVSNTNKITDVNSPPQVIPIPPPNPAASAPVTMPVSTPVNSDLKVTGTALTRTNLIEIIRQAIAENPSLLAKRGETGPRGPSGPRGLTGPQGPAGQNGQNTDTSNLVTQDQLSAALKNLVPIQQNSVTSTVSSFSLSTSAQLAGMLSDETGTGSVVFSTSPTLVTPNLGTPTALTLTNATGLPISTGISGLGAGVATFLATPSSANLATAITDETGSGALAFANSPTITTPTFSTNFTSPIWKPAADSTTAIQINKADGTTNIVNVDTTNGRVGIGTSSPAQLLHVDGGSSDSAALFSSTVTSSTLNSGALSPSAQGNDASIGSVDWLPSGGTGTIYSVDSAGMTYSSGSGSPSHYLTATGYGFAIPGNATIVGVVALVHRRAGTSSDVRDASVKLIKGGVVSGTDKADLVTFWNRLFEDHTYGTSSDLWGLTLTPADINASNFGIAISASGTVATPIVDYVSLTVYYTTTGTQNFALGIDNSDSGNFKISGSAALGTSDLFTVTPTGNVGIGVAPTARLTLAAGTATAGTAPLKLTSGTNLTAAEAGAFEFDGTYLYFTPTTVRNTIVLNNTTNALVRSSIFIGSSAGSSATAATDSNFIGLGAGNNATNASDSNFLGNQAGYLATNADHSNFLGTFAGQLSTNANGSNFLGYYAGNNAASASYSNFLGNNAGNSSTNGAYSNFIGYYAGYSAASASYSNIFGYQAGKTFVSNDLGANNIIIGTNISLPNGTANSINIGGVLFGTGTYSTTTGDPSIVPVAGGQIGIGVIPTLTFNVSAAPAAGTSVAEIDNTLGGTTQNNVLTILGGNNTGVAASQLITYKRTDGTVIGSVSQNAAATVAFNTSSDRRIKENIVPTSYGLADLLKINVEDFDFMSDPSKAKMTGFIAQDLYQIFPQAVTTNGDNGTSALAQGATPWMVDYSKLTPLIVKAVQDLDLNIESIAVPLDTANPKSFADRFFAKITAWLGDATNGIAKIFTNEVDTKNLCVLDDAGGKTCVTKNQLDALLVNSTPSTVTATSATTTTTTTTAPSTTTTTPSDTTTTPTSTTPTSTPTSTPSTTTAPTDTTTTTPASTSTTSSSTTTTTDSTSSPQATTTITAPNTTTSTTSTSTSTTDTTISAPVPTTTTAQ